MSAARRAALKGWATRRAHAKARSQAAKKGWETRRANEKQSARKTRGFKLQRERDRTARGHAGNRNRGRARESTPREALASAQAGEVAARTLDTLEDWIDFYDEYDGDYDEIDVEITPSYGKGQE
jgi:hypothetical protein